jgi:hypothetical protein
MKDLEVISALYKIQDLLNVLTMECTFEQLNRVVTNPHLPITDELKNYFVGGNVDFIAALEQCQEYSDNELVIGVNGHTYNIADKLTSLRGQ